VIDSFIKEAKLNLTQKPISLPLQRSNDGLRGKLVGILGIKNGSAR